MENTERPTRSFNTTDNLNEYTTLEILQALQMLKTFREAFPKGFTDEHREYTKKLIRLKTERLQQQKSLG